VGGECAAFHWPHGIFNIRATLTLRDASLHLCRRQLYVHNSIIYRIKMINCWARHFYFYCFYLFLFLFMFFTIPVNHIFIRRMWEDGCGSVGGGGVGYDDNNNNDNNIILPHKIRALKNSSDDFRADAVSLSARLL